MQRKFSTPFKAILIVGILAFGVAGLVVAQDNFFFVGSTNTVTQVNYPTATTTSTVTSTGTVTETGTPYETVTTATVSGTQTYTTTVTETTGATATATSTLNTDYYFPYQMYWTTNTGPTTPGNFFRSLSPFVVSGSPLPTTDSISETTSGGGLSQVITLSITDNSGNYYDLGYYYEFQSLGSLNTFLTGTPNHAITITGTNFAVNLWLNTGSWVWAPTGTPGTELLSGIGSTGTYGLGTTTGTATISSSTTFNSFQGHCSGSYTIALLAGGSCAGISSSTPFAIWVGIDATTPSSIPVTATITGMYSTPYP